MRSDTREDGYIGAMFSFLLRRLRVTHAGFLVGFPAALYVACNALNIGKLATWFQGTGGLELMAFSAYLLVGLCLFIAVFALLAHPWTIKPVAILLVAASGAATYFIAKYNVAVDSSMVINTVNTDATEVGQLLSRDMLPYAILLIVVPAFFIVRAEIVFAASARYLLATAAVFAGALVIAVALLYANFHAIHRAGNVSSKYIVYTLVPVNVISGSVSAASKSLRAAIRADPRRLDLPVRVTKPGNLVVVLAIGESSRRESFGVYGYSRRDTTPRLRQIEGLHLLHGIARRGSTIYALREILEKQDVKLTTLTDKAGVSTTCLVNYTLYDNCAAVGETKATACGHGGKCYDEDVIPLLDRALDSYESGYRFVVLHFGGGSHGPLYANRHPPEFLRFKPTCNDADVANRCTSDQLHNSYDNTIAYVDHVLAESIASLDRSGAPYVFIYVSDHGESLGEDGVLFHGMPPGMALPPQQAEIPLIIRSSVPIPVKPKPVYSQPDIFDTVLDLFAIEVEGFDRSGSFVSRQGGADSSNSRSSKNAPL